MWLILTIRETDVIRLNNYILLSDIIIITTTELDFSAIYECKNLEHYITQY